MIEHYYLLGTKVSLTNSQNVLDIIKNYDFSKNNYICLFGLLELLQSYTNLEFQNSLNNSLINPLHSRLIEFYLNIKGNKNIEPIDALWFFKELLNENLTHFFYGSNDNTLNKISKKISTEFSNSKVLGYKSAPFVNVDEIKNNDLIKNDIKFINSKKPDIIWIGIGGWKQDLLMHYFYKYLDKGLMIGVGAVFDLFADNIKLSPLWMKRMGIRWLYYLIQQPVYRTSKLLNLLVMLSFAAIKKKIM